MGDPKKIIKRLVRRAQNGDSEAFGKIYDLLVTRVYRFTLWRVGQREDAEDITEEVFLKAWQALGSYHETGPPFEAWLFRICRNAVIDHYRTKKQTVSLEQVVNLADEQQSLEDKTHQKIQAEAVIRSLAKIKSTYQEIIVLKFIEEKDNDEISIILGKPKDHIRVLQSRALRVLKKVLEDDQQS